MPWPRVPLHLGDQGRHQISINSAARATHLHVLGASGRGKTTYLEYLIRQDINDGNGLCVVDPHGGLVENILHWAARHQSPRQQKIMLLDLANKDWRFGFNPLASFDESNMERRAEEMVAALGSVFGDEDADRTVRFSRVATNILYACAELGMSFPLAHQLVNPTDPMQLRQYVTNELKSEYYRDQMARLDSWANSAQGQRVFFEQTESTENRFARLMRSSQVRDSLNLINHALDFRRAMEEGHVILVNLATRDRLSDTAAYAYGRMLIRQLVAAARNRKHKFPRARPFYLYLDECQHFLGEDTEIMLDETRKFGLHCVLSHQRLGQLGDRESSLYNAVMNGAQTKVVFGVLNPDDALTLAQYLYMDHFDPNLIKEVLSKEQAVGTRKTELKSRSETQGVSHVPEVTNNSSASMRSETSPGEITSTSESFGAEGEPSGTTESLTSAEASFVYAETESSSTTPEHSIYSSSSTRSGAEAFETLYEKRPAGIVSIDEQLLLAAQTIRRQSVGEVTIKIVEHPPKTLKVPHIKLPAVVDLVVESFTNRILASTYFALPKPEAEQAIKLSRDRLLARINNEPEPVEYSTSRAVVEPDPVIIEGKAVEVAAPKLEDEDVTDLENFSVPRKRRDRA